MSKTTELTVCQQHWLEHVLACDKSECTAKEYADEHGLSVGGLYNARCVLKKKGAWSGGDVELVSPAPREPAEPATTFHRVTVKPAPRDEAPVLSPSQPSQSDTPCRVHLPNGVMLEVMTGANAVALAAVVEAAGAWT
jgi:hypothetical protein